MGAVFTRPATVNGERFAAGDPVPEGAFTGRRLAQMITLRRVVDDGSDHAKLLVEATVTTPAETPTQAPPVAAFASPDAEPTVQSEPDAPTVDGDYPYPCSVEDCDRRFSSSRGRSNHESRTHGST